MKVNFGPEWIAVPALSDWERLREHLTQTGNSFDGHVTNGSLEAQMRVVEHFLSTHKIPHTNVEDVK